MHKLAPLTKLILTLFVTLWAILLNSPLTLAILSILEISLLIFPTASQNTYKGIISLFCFASLLAILQYLLAENLTLALVTALKMIAMTLIFFILLLTTKMQDLSTALVSQCRIPFEYAFMFTAALRFIPDFLNEFRSIQEAQACRGYFPKGNPITRLTAYAAILKPLVLKAVSKSETMALSLELRGFASRKKSCFNHRVKLSPPDYIFLAVMSIFTMCLITGNFV